MVSALDLFQVLMVHIKIPVGVGMVLGILTSHTELTCLLPHTGIPKFREVNNSNQKCAVSLSALKKQTNKILWAEDPAQEMC